jgi:uncharacterized protein YbjT (DUF2867 family)
MILITGATGTNGSELLQQLSASGAPARALVRNKNRARSIQFPGVELVEGDFSKPETFTSALEGVDRLFLLVPSSPQAEARQCAFVDAAKRNGVRHIVKLSQLGAHPDAPARFQRYHGIGEEHILRSGLEYTLLRPNLFMQGFFNFQPLIATQGVFYACAGTARVSVVDVRDIARLAVMALTESGHEGKTYELTGPESLTHAEMAEILSEETGRTVKYVEISPNSMRHVLLDLGLPAWQADGVIEDYEAFRRGVAGKITTTVEDLTGVYPMSFEEFVRDHVDEFRSPTVGAA